jgi:hypothetical protein
VPPLAILALHWQPAPFAFSSYKQQPLLQRIYNLCAVLTVPKCSVISVRVNIFAVVLKKYSNEDTPLEKIITLGGRK